MSSILCSENGVAAQLKKLNPKMFHVHCVAHRLSLAAVDAAKEIKMIKQFKDDLVQVCK